MFDMYAYFANVPRKDVYKDLCWKMGRNLDKNGEPRKAVPITPPVPEEVESPLMDVESRHATYTALLSRLSLAQDHRENLRNRGLTDAEIDRLGYKTTPVAGMSMMAKQLRSEGYYLAGVPGFFRKESGEWTFVHEARGILIPVRDQKGLIQGLQIRRDNTEKRKFRWVSSTDRKDGCKAEGWAHLAGSVSAQMILTEGPMKADVIHELTGISVIAVPGVNTLICEEFIMKIPLCWCPLRFLGLVLGLNYRLSLCFQKKEADGSCNNAEDNQYKKRPKPKHKGKECKHSEYDQSLVRHTSCEILVHDNSFLSYLHEP